MSKDKEYAEYAILQAVGNVLNCQIEVIGLTQGANEIQLNLHDSIARVDSPTKIIRLIRVNNNHYHATGVSCMFEQQSSDSLSSSLQASIEQTLLDQQSSKNMEGIHQEKTPSRVP